MDTSRAATRRGFPFKICLLRSFLGEIPLPRVPSPSVQTITHGDEVNGVTALNKQKPLSPLTVAVREVKQDRYEVP